ncbi:MAG: hypothetical protein ACOVN0_09430 [Niveispirillum sp.]|uniref:hypothetical protein n=1 Tax=Niveispirillum sp. TaxID=1917217 RepID=UPI003BA5909C
MRKLAIGTLLAAITLVPTLPTSAKDPKPELLAKAMQVVQAEKGYSRWVRFTPEGYAASWGRPFPTGLDPALRARMDEASVQVRDIVGPASDRVYAKILAEHIAESDLDAVLAFVASPAGQARRAALEAAEYRPDLNRTGAMRTSPEMRAAIADKAASSGLVVPKEWPGVRE